MSAAKPLTYAQRAGNYIRQRTGRQPDEKRFLCDQVTPRQRRRMFKKDRRLGRDYGIKPRYDLPPDRLSDQEAEAAVAEIERRFLGDLDNWKPTGVRDPYSDEPPF